MIWWLVAFACFLVLFAPEHGSSGEGIKPTTKKPKIEDLQMKRRE